MTQNFHRHEFSNFSDSEGGWSSRTNYSRVLMKQASRGEGSKVDSNIWPLNTDICSHLSLAPTVPSATHAHDTHTPTHTPSHPIPHTNIWLLIIKLERWEVCRKKKQKKKKTLQRSEQLGSHEELYFQLI